MFRRVLVLFGLSDFLYPLLQFDLYFARNAANLQKVDNQEHMVDGAAERLETDFVVSGVGEVDGHDL